MNMRWQAALTPINFIILAVLLSFLFALIKIYAGEDVGSLPSLEHEKAVMFMESDPDRAEKILEYSSTLTERMDYALFLHAFRPHTRKNIRLIRAITDEVNSAALDSLKSMDESLNKIMNKKGSSEAYRFLFSLEGPWNLASAIDMFGPLNAYDGTDKPLIATLQYGSVSGVIRTGLSLSYEIPCGVLSRRPALLEALDELYGGNRAGYQPVSGCQYGRGHVSGFPDELIQQYKEMATKLDGDFLDNHRGSNRVTLSHAQERDLEYLRLKPDVGDVRKQGIPYETWSYMSLSNRKVFLPFKALYLKTVDAVARYYHRQKGIPETESLQGARVRLTNLVFGGECGKGKPGASLRKLIIESVPLAQIHDFVHSDQFRNTASLAPFKKCSKHAGIDPLIHIAVGNTEVLRYLFDFSRTLNLTHDERVKIDFQMGVNEVNIFHKTPLMTAAQHDLVESARFLIQHGANINSVTLKDLSGTYYPDLKHDHRTALMYAAASGSLEMIRLLLDHGADPLLKDTKGLKALDYLEGQGSLEANSLLSPDELLRARTLLLSGVEFAHNEGTGDAE